MHHINMRYNNEECKRSDIKRYAIKLMRKMQTIRLSCDQIYYIQVTIKVKLDNVINYL